MIASFGSEAGFDGVLVSSVVFGGGTGLISLAYELDVPVIGMVLSHAAVNKPPDAYDDVVVMVVLEHIRGSAAHQIEISFVTDPLHFDSHSHAASVALVSVGTTHLMVGNFTFNVLANIPPAFPLGITALASYKSVPFGVSSMWIGSISAETPIIVSAPLEILSVTSTPVGTYLGKWNDEAAVVNEHVQFDCVLKIPDGVSSDVVLTLSSHTVATDAFPEPYLTAVGVSFDESAAGNLVFDTANAVSVLGNDVFALNSTMLLATVHLGTLRSVSNSALSNTNILTVQLIAHVSPWGNTSHAPRVYLSVNTVVASGLSTASAQGSVLIAKPLMNVSFQEFAGTLELPGSGAASTLPGSVFALNFPIKLAYCDMALAPALDVSVQHEVSVAERYSGMVVDMVEYNVDNRGVLPDGVSRTAKRVRRAEPPDVLSGNISVASTSYIEEADAICLSIVVSWSGPTGSSETREYTKSWSTCNQITQLKKISQNRTLEYLVLVLLAVLMTLFLAIAGFAIRRRKKKRRADEELHKVTGTGLDLNPRTNLAAIASGLLHKPVAIQREPTIHEQRMSDGIAKQHRWGAVKLATNVVLSRKQYDLKLNAKLKNASLNKTTRVSTEHAHAVRAAGLFGSYNESSETNRVTSNPESAEVDGQDQFNCSRRRGAWSGNAGGASDLSSLVIPVRTRDGIVTSAAPITMQKTSEVPETIKVVKPAKGFFAGLKERVGTRKKVAPGPAAESKPDEKTPYKEALNALEHLVAVREQVMLIKMSEIAEIKSFAQPPKVVVDVVTCCCLMLGNVRSVDTAYKGFDEEEHLRINTPEHLVCLQLTLPPSEGYINSKACLGLHKKLQTLCQ